MFLEDLATDWAQHGPATIEACRKADPVAYLRLIASILPKDIGLHVSTNPLAELTDEQLQNVMEDLEAATASADHRLIEIESSLLTKG